MIFSADWNCGRSTITKRDGGKVGGDRLDDMAFRRRRRGRTEQHHGNADGDIVDLGKFADVAVEQAEDTPGTMAAAAPPTTASWSITAMA